MEPFLSSFERIAAFNAPAACCCWQCCRAPSTCRLSDSDQNWIVSHKSFHSIVTREYEFVMRLQAHLKRLSF